MGKRSRGTMGTKGMTYAGSGVDVSAEGRAIRSLIGTLTFKRKGYGHPVDLGPHFTGIIDFGDGYLSLCTDGVGSKMLIAEEMGKWDTVGIDCMAMNVNDMICIGAEPLAFVDYIAAHEPSQEVLTEIGRGLNEGARMANVSIIGGETASLPDMVSGYDLAGTCLGYVKKGNMISGSSIKVGDELIGLRSSGPHSNGYSLIRKVIKANKLGFDTTLEELVESAKWKRTAGEPGHRAAVERWAGDEPALSLGQALLTPTNIYVRDVLTMLRRAPPDGIHGLAHITGGGLRNLVRLKEDVCFVLEGPLKVPPVLRLVQVLGGVDEFEMYSTFNMGMGMCLVVDPEISQDVCRSLKRFGAKLVGRVEEGHGVLLKASDMRFGNYI